MATGEVPNIVIPWESSSVERRGSPGVFFPKPQDQKEVLLLEHFYREKVLEVWRRANIPTSDVSWVKKKILKLYEEYGDLAKSKSRRQRRKK
ncbi:hypothetical protein GWK47_028011 [Chionoecetes opilio]|uniref:Uncharacterized protein n=1 Tax=Chionoecetes opilio TaxID=41210 RepID=A0A8J4YNX1_CHIOP|nr:hypothetical protein GWK47_028011 [Chionoecetes opilio]